MAMNNFTWTLIALASRIAFAYGIECTPGICELQEPCPFICEQTCTLNGGVYTKNATFCGCCDACLTKLVEGDVCYDLFLTGLPPTGVCEDCTTCQFLPNSETAVCTRTESKDCI